MINRNKNFILMNWFKLFLMPSINLHVLSQISRFFYLDLQVFGILGLRGLHIVTAKCEDGKTSCCFSIIRDLCYLVS